MRAERLRHQMILILLRGDHNGTFSRPIKAALDEGEIEYSDPEIVDRMLAEPENRRMLETFRLLVNRNDSFAWASLLYLTNGIGDSFLDYIYDRARAARIQFGEALLQANEQNFPDGPRVSAARATTLIRTVNAWLDAHELPEATPEDGLSLGN